MKRTFLSLMFLMAFIACFAQSETAGKETVYIDYFTKSSDVNSSDVETLRNKIIEGFSATQRVTVIDVASNEILKAEALRRQESSAMGDATARKEEMSTLGAGSLIQGHVASIITTRKKDSDGNVSYESTVKFTIKIVDASTGTLTATESFDNLGIDDTAETSVARCLDISNASINKFVQKYFKVEGTIVQVKDVKEKKGKKMAETVYINLGTANGVKKGQAFAVYEIVNVAGTMGEQVIGSIKVSQIMSESLSLCKVGKKGGDRIFDIMQEGAASDNGPKIVIRTKDTTIWDDIKGEVTEIVK